MIGTRLALALDEGGLILPANGSCAVVKPTGGADLSLLSTDNTVIVQGFKPDFEIWCARGYRCVPELVDTFDVMVLCLPRSKSEARALIAKGARREGTLIVIDGQKTDGVESILRAVRKRVDVAGLVTKAHGRLFWFIVPDEDLFADWGAGPALTATGFWSAPGVFSADDIDPASALLASSLPEDLGARVVDLGAGWGYLTAHVLKRSDVETVDLVEAEFISIECAKRNVMDARAAFHWADATHWRAPQPMDTVVMNPPFHAGRMAEPELGQAFIRAAARMLASHGTLWMVANRHLPYEDVLNTAFANVFELGSDARFKLLSAKKPKRGASLA
ncbi:MAG: class I SAM-dependent methyltransferase [Pseudomonadota bacterium]